MWLINMRLSSESSWSWNFAIIERRKFLNGVHAAWPIVEFHVKMRSLVLTRSVPMQWRSWSV